MCSSHSLVAVPYCSLEQYHFVGGLVHALPLEGGHFHALEDVTSFFMGPALFQPTDLRGFLISGTW